MFSFERNIDIADPNGASSLLANMKSVEAPDKDTVVFNLKEPDATWPSVLATASFAIVPKDGPTAFPADKLQDDNSVVGSGRYTVQQYEPGQQTVMQANDNYKGEDPAQTNTAIIQYFDKASALKLAVEQGDVDVAYRSLSPTDLEDLKSADGVNVVQGEGAEIRYLNFNLDLQPGDDDAQKLAVRQAVAQLIDRQSIVDNVYNGTVKPLYSMIPASLPYHTDAFKEQVRRARAPTRPSRSSTTPASRRRCRSRSGGPRRTTAPSSGDEYAEIKRQLDASGLFDVTLKSTEWNQYSEAAFTDKYPAVPARLVPGLSGPGRLRRQLPVEHQLPEHPLRQPGGPEAAGDREGVDRRRDAPGGVRRRSSRSRRRKRRTSRSGRATRSPRCATGSTGSRTRSTRPSSSASG